MEMRAERETTKRLLAAIAVLGAVASPATQAAQPATSASSAYPDKPIRLIIGSAPGSGPDIISRLAADRLYGVWGQRIVVDSRPGVAGVISAELALRSDPDGYTWMMLTSQLFVATSVYPDLKFNLDKDFVSISLIGTVPFGQMGNPLVPAKSIAELIALAKKSPGKLRYGSAGAGASEHLSGVMFNRMTGTDMLHVPYKGIAQAIADTLSNEVQLTYAVYPAARPHIDSGRLRATGVTNAGGRMRYVAEGQGARLPTELALAGVHNVQNALAAIAVGREVGVADDAIARALAEFKGVGRRFQRHGDVLLEGGGAFTLIDDYGHHPAEMAATLAAARESFPGRRIVLAFQPHRFTRTRDLFEDFVRVLSTVDAVVLADVYPAGEAPIVAADGRALARAVRVAGRVEPVFVETVADMAAAIRDVARDGDVVVTMGAGSIGTVPAQLAGAA
jgi:tripartite-type tricarboxylate transporter receptor subunit TctC